MSEWKYSKIPKVAFTYWSGRMSYLHYCTLKSFRELNPDWKIVLYCPTCAYEGNNTWSSPQHIIKYTKKDYTEDALKLDIDIIKIDLVAIGFRNDVPEVFKSNYVTYYILSKYGGVWFDMDILFIKPMNELNLENNIIKGNAKSIEVVISYSEASYWSTGLLISAPESKFFKLLFDELLKNFNPKLYESATNDLYPRLFGNLNGIIQKFPDLHFADLSMDIVYPYKFYQMHILFTKNDIRNITDKTIGIHWYNGHPITETFLNSENYGADLTINTIIKKYLNYRN